MVCHSQDVFLRVLAALDPTSFRMAFHAWMKDVLSLLSIDSQVAIDEQTHRRSADARKIIDSGGDYLLGLKGNQTNLHEEVKQALVEALDERRRAVDEVPPPKVTQETQVDAGHGRVETRTAYVVEGFEPWVPSGARWQGLASVVAIRRVARTRSRDCRD